MILLAALLCNYGRGFCLIDIGTEGSVDEIWLAVERLHERKPPEVTNPTLRPWVKMTQSPTEDPRLRESVDGASLIVAGPIAFRRAMAASL